MFGHKSRPYTLQKQLNLTMPFLAEGKFPAHYTLSGDVACRYTFYYSNSSQLRCVHALKELTKSQPTIMT